MSMKKNIKWIALAIIGTALVIAGCIKLTDVIIPSKIQPNSTIEIHVKGQVKPETGYGPEGMALAILAPKAWDLAHKAELYMTTTNLQKLSGTADLQEERMVVMSDEPMPKCADAEDLQYQGMSCSAAYYAKNGDLGNVGGDVEWVVFKNGTTEVKVDSYSEYIDIDVKILLKVGDEPIKCKMGFEFFGAKEGWENVGFKDNLTVREVVVGDGSVNYLEYPLTSTTPDVWRYGDFFAVNFAAEAGGVKMDLYGEPDVYMCGTAILEDGTVVTQNKRDSFTHMNRLNESTYQKYIFPTHYFGLPNTTKIVDLYFYFTNKDGSKVVTSNDFEYGFQFRQKAK